MWRIPGWWLDGWIPDFAGMTALAEFPGTGMTGIGPGVDCGLRRNAGWALMRDWCE